MEKREFKVGDWVFSENLGASLYNYEKNPVKILEIGDGYFHYDLGSVYSTSFDKGEKSSRYELKQITRKATPEEIQQAQKTIVKMYSSNKGMFEIEVVDGKAYYRPENKELPEEWIRDIINSYDEILIQQRNGVNPYNVQIAGLHVGCYQNCRKEDWEKVYKLLK